jgi:hypothetical protein
MSDHIPTPAENLEAAQQRLRDYVASFDLNTEDGRRKRREFIALDAGQQRHKMSGDLGQGDDGENLVGPRDDLGQSQHSDHVDRRGPRRRTELSSPSAAPSGEAAPPVDSHVTAGKPAGTQHELRPAAPDQSNDRDGF